ncbi:ParB/RepB/Spo0J family partition protein [Inquilinus sp. OTU3971]|uniref:ParB/RepB/Spo0J family partition protein n=1 Tax=Inquilinus sp. OTU3971 TaxID=3043855 RepID=UPI00313BD2F0
MQLMVDPGRLQPNPWNTNHMSPENEAKLDASIARLGMFKPVVVRELDTGDLQILGGAHRAQSAVRVGIEKIPVINLGRIGDQKAKEISLVDNARYGADDALELAELMNDLGTADDLSSFLPYSDAEMNAIFSSTSIDLDDMELGAEDDTADEIPETSPARVAKTHTIMRFKVALGDAEAISALIEKTQNRHGLTASDELTNAGDALVHLLLRKEEA